MMDSIAAFITSDFSGFLSHISIELAGLAFGFSVLSLLFMVVRRVRG